MTITTGPRPLTDAEKEAWTLHLQKIPVSEIQQRTGLLPSQIAAAVDLGQVHARQAMQSSTAVLLPEAPKPAPTPRPAVAPPSKDDRILSVGQLLVWAEQSGHARALTLAARIRANVDELRTFHAQHDARTKAQADIDRLMAELEAAKTALREAGGRSKPPAHAPKPDARAERAAIRAWARMHGMEVADRGVLPDSIVTAYHAAGGGEPQ